MAFRNLRAFVDALDRAGELKRVNARVSAELEITEITDLMSKSKNGGKALLFENVEGSEFPVLTNAFGSERRMAMALGVERIEDIGSGIDHLLEMDMPETLGKKIGMAQELLSLSKCLPRTVRTSSAPCQEVVIKGDDVDLGILPVLKCWPMDGGRFFTLPVVFTKGMTDGKRNAGMYRMQIFDRNTTGMHWHIHKDGSHNYNEYRKAGKRMEVAVAVGTDPAVTYAATAPMPKGIDEMLLAGYIRMSPVKMVKCKTIDMEVPAESEFVLEGYVDPDETRIEGPFGDHTGYYSLQGEYPVFHVTAITHRRNAIYSATIVGRPPMEDCYIAKATERIFLPPIRKIVPEILDYWMPWEGVFHNIVVVAIDKEYPMQPRKVMNALWGTGQMSFAKMILVVDDIKVLADRSKVWRHVLEKIDVDQDLFVTEGVLDVLDHSAQNALFGGKLGIDATDRIEGEGRRGKSCVPISIGLEELMSDLKGLDGGFHACRIVYPDARNPMVMASVDKRGRSTLSYIEKIRERSMPLFEGVLMLFDEIDISDNSLTLWKFFNNVDPRRDLYKVDGLLVVDATKKNREDGFVRDWPGEIIMSSEVKAKVRQRAGELGITELVLSAN